MDQSNSIEILKQWIGTKQPVDALISNYQQQPPKSPLWQLLEDIQQLAMVYSNILEKLKSGEGADVLRQRFEKLGLVPTDTLPNPDDNALTKHILEKLSKLRDALLEIVAKHAQELINDLAISGDFTASLGIGISFPPTFTLSVQQKTQ